MDSSEFIIDRRLYSDEVATRAAHRYSGEYCVEILPHQEGLSVSFASHDGSPVPLGLRSRFFNDLLDENLRAMVRRETRGLHQELVRAALAQALPTTDSSHEV
jgi:His-Xaa-Ser system protein HxsD